MAGPDAAVRRPHTHTHTHTHTQTHTQSHSPCHILEICRCSSALERTPLPDGKNKRLLLLNGCWISNRDGVFFFLCNHRVGDTTNYSQFNRHDTHTHFLLFFVSSFSSSFAFIYIVEQFLCYFQLILSLRVSLCVCVCVCVCTKKERLRLRLAANGKRGNGDVRNVPKKIHTLDPANTKDKQWAVIDRS